jgi:hypothetical protein
MKRLIAIAGAAAFALGFATAQAQETETEDVLIPHHAMAFAPANQIHAGGQTFEFIAHEMGMPGKVVKGAPYSAESSTEIVQVLADGNKITRKSTASVARDSDGRTRREHSLPAIGLFASDGQPPKIVNIHDPVSGASWILDENVKLARKMPVFELRSAGPGEAGKRVHVQRDVRVIARAGQGEPLRSEVAVIRKLDDGKREAPNEESLGKRNIEGLECDGNRTTVTIPAGEIGNEKPIEIVSERWYSPELQLVVLATHKDPQTGETTTKLSNISRAEPPRSLFEVPADYKVAEPGEPFEVRIEKKN